MRKKHTLEDCQKIAEERGGKCLSVEYINNKTKMSWECEHKHQWLAKYDNICQGKWCPHCAQVMKHTIEDCQSLAISYGGVCLCTKYINSKTKMLWECEHKHQWLSTYSNIYRGRWCPYCAGTIRHTIEDCYRLAEDRGGTCLSTQYINALSKMLWECECGHKWTTTFHKIQQGHWCPICVGLMKHILADCQKSAEYMGGKCLSIEYINNKTKMLWECENGHQWNTSYNSIQQGCWCPECSLYKTQKELTAILSKIFNEPGKTIRPEWLINPKTNRKLEIDCWLQKHKIAIEYHGKQHFEPINWSGTLTEEEMKEKTQYIKYSDRLKKRLMKQAIKDGIVNHFVVFTYKENITEEYVRIKLRDLI